MIASCLGNSFWKTNFIECIVFVWGVGLWYRQSRIQHEITLNSHLTATVWIGVIKPGSMKIPRKRDENRGFGPGQPKPGDPRPPHRWAPGNHELDRSGSPKSEGPAKNNWQFGPDETSVLIRGPVSHQKWDKTHLNLRICFYFLVKSNIGIMRKCGWIQHVRNRIVGPACCWETRSS